ncbi:SDR family oxidoreductase [Xanthobacter sp. VNH20]|uniref:SDR family oxidoreductase n=1 Tax=Xanthobacter sp. VNH20 TaxID=3156616 RepID=UPI0032B3FA5D
MDLGLKSKIVLITGGSKGIGLACAKLFSEEGAAVAINSRSDSNLAEAKKCLSTVLAVKGDVSDSHEATRVVDEVEARLGPVDILVNCAGAAKRADPDSLTPELWKQAMESKFLSYINVIDPLIKRMAQRGSGVIINVIGIGGKIPSPLHLPGGAANASLMLATAGLATAYGPQGVRVVGVNPGMTATDLMRTRLEAEASMVGRPAADLEQDRVQKIPLGRMASAEEIASTVVFLSSRHAGYITGANISVDGGSSGLIV